VTIKQTCACGAAAVGFSELHKEWMCGSCIVASHAVLVTAKNAEACWPPGPAGRVFGAGSVVVAGPGGLLEQLLGVNPG
jgi:hypothetical protein